MLNPPRDIRNFVPQINPTWLPPPPIGAQYPKMMTKGDEKNTPFAHPNGRPVIVQNEKEEAEFWAKIKSQQSAKPQTVAVTAEPVAESAPQEDVADETAEDQPKRRGRPPKVVLPD